MWRAAAPDFKALSHSHTSSLFPSGGDGEQQGGGTRGGSDGRRDGGPGVRGMRGSDRGPLPALLHGAVLAHALPQVLLLPRSAGRVQQHLLQQRRHDPLQERLHQVGLLHTASVLSVGGSPGKTGMWKAVLGPAEDDPQQPLMGCGMFIQVHINVLTGTMWSCGGDSKVKAGLRLIHTQLKRHKLVESSN